MFNKRKRFSKSVAMIMLLCLAVTGCGEDKKEPEKKTEQEISYDTPLVIGYSKMDTNIDSFRTNPSNDNSLASYTQLKLLAYDENGKIINKGIGTSDSTKDYDGNIADIYYEYDEEGNKTTYTVDIHENIYFSDGTQLDADDVIFSYYVYLDKDYKGPSNVRNYDIVGVKNYQNNNSMADSIVISDEQIEDAFKNPDSVIKNYFKTLVSDVLKSEYERFDTLYGNDEWKAYTDIYPNKKDLFAAFYSIDAGYTSSGKEGETVLSDIIKQYGGDYEKLGEKFADDSKCFDSQIKSQIQKRLYNLALRKNGEPVDSITGIQKTGDLQVKISMNGIDTSAVYGIFDVYIASITGYEGCEERYNYEGNSFGVERGNAGKLKMVDSYPAAGPYIFESKEDNTIKLIRNEKYYKGKPYIENVHMVKMKLEELINALDKEQIDMAVSPATKDNYQLIQTINEQEEKLHTINYPISSYSYIGLNAQTMKIGKNSNSKESIALRKAFTSLFDYYKAESISEFFGECAVPINYPVSKASWATVAGSKEEITQENALENVRKYFSEAGYKVDEESGRVIKAPKDGSLTFDIIINQENMGENPASILAQKTAETLSGIGITLNILSEKSASNYYDYIKSGAVKMWAGTWTTPKDPDLYQFYYSQNIYGMGGTDTNYYRISDKHIDELILKSHIISDFAMKKAAYRQIMDEVMDKGVITPFYQREEYLLLSAKKIDISSVDVPTISTYRGIPYQIRNIKLK